MGGDFYPFWPLAASKNMPKTRNGLALGVGTNPWLFFEPGYKAAIGLGIFVMQLWIAPWTSHNITTSGRSHRLDLIRCALHFKSNVGHLLLLSQVCPCSRCTYPYCCTRRLCWRGDGLFPERTFSRGLGGLRLRGRAMMLGLLKMDILLNSKLERSSLLGAIKSSFWLSLRELELKVIFFSKFKF